MDYFSRKRQFEGKNVLKVNLFLTNIFSLHKTVIDGLELLVDYCNVLFSGLDSNSDGTHSLQSIRW